MSSNCDYDVLIVGCGPVGVVAAHLLGQSGLSVLVIERDHQPYDLPRAIHLDHEIMRIFQSLGLAELLLPQLSMPAGAMHFGADRGVIRQFQAIVNTDRLGWGSDYFFYQPDMERALRSALADRETVTVRLGQRVVGVAQDDEGVSVLTQGGDGGLAVRAQYVLACDGGRSTVRNQVGIPLEDLGFDEPWLVVDALVDGPVVMPDLTGTPDGVDMQQVMFILGDPARPTSVIPGVGRHRRWEFMMLPNESAEDFADPAAVKPLLAPWLGETPFEIVRAAAYRFHALLAERWRSRRVLLVGDAAHQTPPFFGQGLCHGLRDAANLAWKLRMVIEGSADATLLDTYQSERLPQVRSVVEASMRVGRYICTRDPDAARRRDIEMREVALRTPPGYVDIIPSLKAGVLAPSRSEPSPNGSRFIQPPIINADGARTLLDDATGKGFVLLARPFVALDRISIDAAFERELGLERVTIVADDRSRHAPEGSVLDVTGELTKWLDYFGCAGVLLRPDFYVYGVFSTIEEGIEMLQALRGQIAPPAGVHGSDAADDQSALTTKTTAKKCARDPQPNTF